MPNHGIPGYLGLAFSLRLAESGNGVEDIGRDSELYELSLLCPGMPPLNAELLQVVPDSFHVHVAESGKLTDGKLFVHVHLL